jgi:chromosome segregation ATPase
MDFEEKIDAMRTTLELASHDIEGLRANIAADRANIAELHETSQVLMKACESLLRTAENHERRITRLENPS